MHSNCWMKTYFGEDSRAGSEDSVCGCVLDECESESAEDASPPDVKFNMLVWEKYSYYSQIGKAPGAAEPGF